MSYGMGTLDEYNMAQVAVGDAYDSVKRYSLKLKNRKAELWLEGGFPPKATVDIKKAHIDNETVELRYQLTLAEIALEDARGTAKFWEYVMKYELAGLIGLEAEVSNEQR